MKTLLLVSAVVAALGAPAAARAQLSEPLARLGIDFTGYVDASYSRLSRDNVFISTTPSRVFDLERGGVALRQIGLTFAKQPKQGFGGLANFTIGKDADVIAAYDTDPNNGRGCNVATGLNADATKCDKDRFDVTQLFAQYASGPWTLIGGKYVTLAGAEVINSTANTNFSRSILFGYAIPFTHTGVRASYALSDSVNLIAGVNQGWDALKDTNSSNTLELGASFTPVKNLVLSAQGYSGKERVGGAIGTGPEGQRRLLDLVGTFNATEKLAFVLNYDLASQDNAVATAGGTTKAKWSGFAGYVVYQLTDQWRLSVRAEEFDDEHGYRTGVVQKWKEGTVTLSWLPTKALEFRGELRRDRSNVAAFRDRDGISAHKTMSSVGLQALYKF